MKGWQETSMEHKYKMDVRLSIGGLSFVLWRYIAAETTPTPVWNSENQYVMGWKNSKWWHKKLFSSISGIYSKTAIFSEHATSISSKYTLPNYIPVSSACVTVSERKNLRTSTVYSQLGYYYSRKGHTHSPVIGTGKIYADAIRLACYGQNETSDFCCFRVMIAHNTRFWTERLFAFIFNRNTFPAIKA
jgi:hypothetical protein